MRKMFLKKGKGFTLIELLIVIAIIAILATIIILNVINARAKAIDAKVASDLAQASKAAGLCVVEDGTLQAPVGGTNICYPTTTVSAKWPDLTSGYGNWAYNDSATSLIGLDDFTIVASDSGRSKQISCTARGCSEIMDSSGSGTPEELAFPGGNASINYLGTNSLSVSFPEATGSVTRYNINLTGQETCIPDGNAQILNTDLSSYPAGGAYNFSYQTDCLGYVSVVVTAYDAAGNTATITGAANLE